MLESFTLSLVLPLLTLLICARQDAPVDLLHRLQTALAANSQDQVIDQFADREDSDYLFRMAGRSGGLKGLKVAVFPTPQGWESTGKYWATFHTWQELEQDHDPVYRVVETPQGLRLGSEIPEYDCGGKVDSEDIKVDLDPAHGSCDIQDDIKYSREEGHALIFRLNDKFENLNGYPIGGPAIHVHFPFQAYDETAVSSLNPKFSYRIGGLAIVGVDSKLVDPGGVRITYRGAIGNGASYSQDRDQITPTYAYLTSFWVPTLGRLPFSETVHVKAPSDWIIRSEGNLAKTTDGYITYHSPFPISYPKVCAGKYVLAGEDTQNGHDLRSYQFAPVDKTRATNDLAWMKKAIAFYETSLGPFPFKEYDCFDGNKYYGIESYSYTILAPNITTWAVSHEMGHSYFGGEVPCPYVKDSWNEGLTQYVDDVLLHHNPEVTTLALKGVGIHVPLTQMPVAWEYDGATYWRGAYAMEMLDAEIGHDKVLAALQAMIKDRVGKETTWPDLRPYFEKSSGEDLKWFWDQWISGAYFPHVSITSATASQESGKWVAQVVVTQDGTQNPYKLRFGIKLDGNPGQEVSELMTEKQQTFEIAMDSQPTQVSIDPNNSALISVDAPVAVGRQ